MGRRSHETGYRFLSAVVIETSITSSPLPMPVGWLKKDGQIKIILDKMKDLWYNVRVVERWIWRCTRRAQRTNSKFVGLIAWAFESPHRYQGIVFFRTF